MFVGGSCTRDPFGTILCEAWKVDNLACDTIMAAFMSQMTSECERAQIQPPSLAEVLESLPLAINSAGYPDVDLDGMIRQMRRAVPDML